MTIKQLKSLIMAGVFSASMLSGAAYANDAVSKEVTKDAKKVEKHACNGTGGCGGKDASSKTKEASCKGEKCDSKKDKEASCKGEKCDSKKGKEASCKGEKCDSKKGKEASCKGEKCDSKKGKEETK